MEKPKITIALLILSAFAFSGCDALLNQVLQNGNNDENAQYLVSNLNASYLSGNVELSWDYHDQADHYDVWYSSQSGGPYESLGSVWGNHYIHQNVQPNAYHHYKVRIISHDGTYHELSQEVWAYADGGAIGGGGAEEIYQFDNWNPVSLNQGEAVWYYVTLDAGSGVRMELNDSDSGAASYDGDALFSFYREDQTTPYDGFVDLDSTGSDTSVTLADGETRLYIKFYGEASGSASFWLHRLVVDDDSRLGSVMIQDGINLPENLDFDPSITAYDLKVNTFWTSLTFINITPYNPSATVAATIDGIPADIVDGELVVTGFEPSTPKTIVFTVTSSDGSSSTPYTFTLTQAGNNSNLYSLEFSDGTTVSDFGGLITVTVPATQDTLTVIPTAEDQYATITVNGVTVASGSESAPVGLVAGTNESAFVIEVTAPDGSNSQTFYINVEKNLSGDFDLQMSDAVTVDYDAAQKTYTVTTPIGLLTTNIHIYPVDPSAVVVINGSEGVSSSISLNGNYVETSVSVDVTPNNGNGVAEHFTIKIEPNWHADSPENQTTVTYKFQSKAGTDYTLYWNDSTDNANWNEDIRVSVRRPNGTLIKDGLIDGPVTFTANYAEELSVELTASDGSLVGTYAFKVKEGAIATGSYVTFKAGDTAIIVR